MKSKSARAMKNFELNFMEYSISLRNYILAVHYKLHKKLFK